MEKSKSIEASRLPEVVIQHIQSFLSGKEATQTTILSKSWYSAWLTRPNLDFSEHDIRISSEFMRFIKTTMQRYDKLNMKIQSFRLLMKDSNSVNNTLAKRLIVKVMKLGATDLDINGGFLLPREVLESESLVRLSFVGGSINVQDQKVSCSRLKSLRLSRVCIEGNNNIQDIISMCPLIEELVFSQCMCKGTIGNSTRSSRMRVSKAMELGVNDFHKLKILSLETVEIGEWFFRDLPKFVCLKELTLHNCTGYNEIQMCSNSLERIVFLEDNYERRILRAKFDVPQIRNFKYTSSYVPSLSFKTTSSAWESDISFGCVIDSSLIIKLREFLLELSSSKISLDLSINITLKERNEYTSYIISLTKPAMVEKLMLRMNEPYSYQLALLEDLFWSYRPTLIATRNLVAKCVYDYDVVKVICNTLIKQVCTSGLHDLEEVNIQVCGDVAWRWSRPLPHKTLDDSAYLGWIGKQVCLQLKWGDNS